MLANVGMGAAGHLVYLGLGSNLGDREAHIHKAVTLIEERLGSILRQSSLIETEPWGFESDNRFVNAVILCETTLTPREVLKVTQQIERDMGRKKKTKVYGQKDNEKSEACVRPSVVYNDRVIDIDILLYDDLHVDEPDLKIPHPLMYEREFVMVPLKEIKR